MHTMVIADDEEIELKSLSLLIKKEFTDIRIVGLARNGAEMVSFIDQYKPDIAIVDINMPGINGIDAIQLVSSLNVPTRFIINTAYSDFEYAQRALSLKVDYYILKPQKRTDTVAVIRKLCDDIDKVRASRKSRIQVDELFSNIQPVIESEIIYSIFMGEPAVSSFSMWCEINAVQFSGGLMVSLIPVDSADGILASCDKKKLRGYLHSALQDVCTLLATINDFSISILFFIPSKDGDHWESWLTDVLQVLFDKLKSYSNLLLRAGVGRCYPAFEKMPDSYRESIAALRGITDVPISFYRSASSNVDADYLTQLASDLVKSAQSGNFQNLDAVLMAEMPALKSDASIPMYLWRSCQDIALKLPKANTAELQRFFAMTSRQLESGTNPDYRIRQIGENLKLLSGLLRTGGKSDSNPYVVKARKFIEENYKKDLSLEAVADQIGISPFYLSRLLKQELGQTFIGYLTQVRMQEAIKLAGVTRLSIKEIAERTGYSNPTYFCRVFKKFTGQTIGGYRESSAE